MTPITAYTTDSTNALPLYVLDRDGFAAWKAQQPAAAQACTAAGCCAVHAAKPSRSSTYSGRALLESVV